MKKLLSLMLVVILMFSFTSVFISAEEIEYEEITDTYVFADKEKMPDDTPDDKVKYADTIDTYVFSNGKMLEEYEKPKNENKKIKNIYQINVVALVQAL